MLDASFTFAYNFVNKLFILKFQMIMELDLYGHIVLCKWRFFTDKRAMFTDCLFQLIIVDLNFTINDANSRKQIPDSFYVILSFVFILCKDHCVRVGDQRREGGQ